jgi:hypothetical protein
VIRFARWVNSIYSMYGVITSAWFLALVAIVFAWYVIGPVVLTRVTGDQGNDETDGIP